MPFWKVVPFQTNECYKCAMEMMINGLVPESDGRKFCGLHFLASGQQLYYQETQL